jgi:hypothetical protein
MEPILPTWFKYRQGTAASAGENTLKLTAPNLSEAFVGIRRAEDGHFLGVCRRTADGQDAAVTQVTFDSAGDAWGAAFELYRNLIVTGSADQ